MATCEVKAGGWPWFYYIKMSNKLPMVEPNSRSESLPGNLSKLEDFEINRSMSQLLFFKFQKWMVAIYVSIFNFSCSMSQLFLFYGSRNVLLLGISINNCRSGSVPGYFQSWIQIFWDPIVSCYSYCSSGFRNYDLWVLFQKMIGVRVFHGIYQSLN
jgi:hypothetical protein